MQFTKAILRLTKFFLYIYADKDEDNSVKKCYVSSEKLFFSY